MARNGPKTLPPGPEGCANREIEMVSWMRARRDGEAQGFAAAQSFGVAAQDEYTGAITPPRLSAPPSERPLRVTCRD